jgi:predicted RNA-binding Zn-ribbon protein involved in translation (DUF1610 family)
MQVVKTTCPDCGELALLPGDITVTEHKMNPDESTYAFTCPKCKAAITKPAPDAILALLTVAKGVRWNVIQMPAELDEPHSGPPLTLDDLIDLMKELEQL